MKRVRRVKPEPGYHLWLEFDDGLAGMVDLSQELYGPLFEPLRDPRVFAQAFIDEFGVVCWPNGADLAPEVLYEDLATKVRQAS